MANPLKSDPTRTTMLRKKFMADMRRRIRKLRGAIVYTLVAKDALGITVNISKEVWRFQTDPDKLDSFKQWFQGQVDSGILEVDSPGQAWTNEYVESAYKKGMTRAYLDSRKEELAESPDFYNGTKEEFLRSAFMAPETVSKLRLLQTRTFDQLKGFTDQMGQATSRILAEGLANGQGPRSIAKRMTDEIEKLTKTRALVIARTETIHAHAEGQLDSFEKLGAEEIGIKAEWSTAGDDRVCQLCAPLDGVVIPIKEARGIIPRHPNCRCSFTPADKAIKEKGQKRGTKTKEKAFQKSVEAQGGKEKSSWIGKEKS